MPKFSGPNVICVHCGIRGATLHHIYTQKAYPQLRFTKWNLIPLCTATHELAHRKGMVFLSTEFHRIQMWLVANDWRIDTQRAKWVHDIPEGMDKVKPPRP